MKLPEVHPDTPGLDALRAAFGRLTPTSTPRWGTLGPAEVLAHCTAFHRLCLGDNRPGLLIRGLARVLGPVFLRRFLAQSPTETPRNLSTLASLRIEAKGGGEIEAARAAFLASLDAIEACPEGHRHPLYGPMSKADLEGLVRHHLAHHAHQFGLFEAAVSAAGSGTSAK